MTQTLSPTEMTALRELAQLKAVEITKETAREGVLVAQRLVELGYAEVSDYLTGKWLCITKAGEAMAEGQPVPVMTTEQIYKGQIESAWSEVPTDIVLQSDCNRIADAVRILAGRLKEAEGRLTRIRRTANGHLALLGDTKPENPRSRAFWEYSRFLLHLANGDEVPVSDEPVCTPVTPAAPPQPNGARATRSA